MKTFTLSVLTPRECVYEGNIESLVLPTADGEIGFLADREETVVDLSSGVFRFRDAEGKEHFLESDGGIFRIKGRKAVLLCGAAYDAEVAEERKKELAEHLEEERKKQEQSLADYKMTRAALMRAFEKLKRSQIKN